MPAPSQGRGRRVSDTGGLTSVTFTCKKCAFSTHSYGSGWRKHLLEDGHQTEARLAVKHFPTKVKKRAVVVFGISSVKVKAVLKYLGDFATVTDFIFWTERPDFCIATVLHPPSRDFLLRGSHAVNEKRISLRALDEIPEAEWVSICPFASVSVKMEKEEDEDSPVDVFRESSEEEDECPQDDVDPNNETQSFSTSTFSSFNNENSNSNNRRKSLGLSFSTSIFSSDAVGGTTNNDEIGGSSSSDRAVPLSTAIKREREERVKQDKRGDDDEDSDGVVIIEDDDDMEPCADRTINHNQSGDGLKNGLPVVFDLPFVRDASGTGSMDTSSIATDTDSTLNKVLESFYNKHLMDPSLWKLRSRITQEMTLLLRNDFPNCILVPFGIVSSAIVIPSGPAQINLFLDVKRATECTEAGRVITMDVDTAAIDEMIQKVYARLQQCQHSNSSIHNLKKITADKKVEFLYLATGQGQQRVNCSIQSSNFVAVQCSRLANFCNDLDDRVRPLQMIFRHWAFHHKLTKSNNRYVSPGEDSFPSVFLHWLPIHFLIHKNILPSIELLKTTAPTSLLYSGENVGFCNDLNRLGWTKKSDFPRNPVTWNPSAKCILDLATELFDHCADLAELKSRGLTGIICVSLGNVLFNKDLETYNPFSSPHLRRHSISLLKREAEITLQHPFLFLLNMAKHVKNVVPMIRESTHTADCLRKVLSGDRHMDDPIAVLELRTPPTYKISRPHRVNVFLPVPVDENEHPEDGSDSDSEETPTSPSHTTAKDEDETTTNGDNNTAPGSATRKNKIKPFEIQLNLSDDTKGLRLNDDVINQLQERWSEIFVRFNLIVWPTCFGVNLWTFNHSQEDPTPPWGTILEPYMGLIKSSETLKSFSLPAKDFKKELTKVWLHEVSRKLWNAKPPPPSRIVMRDDVLELKKREFSFQCRHIGHSGKATTKKPIGAIIRLQFTEIFYEDKETSKNLKNNIVSVYEKLWKEYVRMQILQWTKQSPPNGTPQNRPTRRQRRQP